MQSDFLLNSEIMVWPFNTIYTLKSQLWPKKCQLWTSRGQLQTPFSTPQTKVQLYFWKVLLLWRIFPSDFISANFSNFLKISTICNFCYVASLHRCMFLSPLWFCIICIFFSSMYIFGGFSGLLLNDVLAYTPPSCLAFSNPTLCAAAGPGLRCHWVNSRCVPWEPKPPEHMFHAPFCPARPGTLIWGPVCLTESNYFSLSVTFSL